MSITMQRRNFMKAAAAVGFVGVGFPISGFSQGSGRRQYAQRTVEAGDFLQFRGQVEDDAFEALVAQLRSKKGPQTVRFPNRNGVLTLSGSRVFDLPDDIRWDFGKSVVRFDGTLKGNSVLMKFGAGSELLGLNIEVSRNAQCDRLLAVHDDTLVDRLQLSTEDQLSNGGDDNSDGLVQIRGSHVNLVACSLAGADRPLAALGAAAKPGDSGALVDVKFGDLRLRNFVCGLRVRNVRDCVISGLVATDKSRNAKTDPGHNAVLAARVQDFKLEKFKIEDAGEHAIRIGGSTNPNELDNKNIQILDGAIRRPGKCGIKFWSAGKAEDVESAKVSSVQVKRISTFDCGYGGKISVNEDAVRLEVVDDFVIEDISAAAEKSAASCHDVIYLAACSNGRISNVTASKAVRSAVWITETLGAGRHAPVGSIEGSNIRSADHRGDFIHLDLPSQKAGPFVFKGLSSRGGANFVGGTADNLSADSDFSGAAEGNAGKINELTNNRRVKVRAAGRT